MEVTLDARKIGDQFRNEVCEMTVWTAGRILRATDGASDMYAAIDQVYAKLERQIEKHKEMIKKENRRQKGQTTEELMKSYQQKIKPKQKTGPMLVKVKRFAMKPLEAEDAAEEMEMLGHDFYMFRNAKTHEVNVIYRRRTGNYGLIEPEIM